MYRLLLLIPILACQLPATEEPTWYKGNTHTHSLWSDGNDFPDMIVDWYRTRGYDFLVLSDHNTLSRGERWMDTSRLRGKDALQKYQARFGDSVDLRMEGGKPQVRLRTFDEMQKMFNETNRFLLVEGEEISARAVDPDYPLRVKHIHINAMNLNQVVKPLKGDSVPDVMRKNLRALREQETNIGRAILDHLNHPNFYYSVSAEELAEVVEEQFFEVYNGHPTVHQNGDTNHPSVETMWDLANAIRIFDLNATPLYGMATDDSHQYHGGNVSPGRGWVMVKSGALEADALVKAMRRGDFYASTGVYLRNVHYDPDNRRLQIQIAPDADTQFTTRIMAVGSATKAGYERARYEGLTIDFALAPEDRCIRAVITSSRPHPNPSIPDQFEQAWTQPVGWKKAVE